MRRRRVIGPGFPYLVTPISTGVAAPYVGPGDIMAGTIGWWGMRAFSLATTGQNLVRIKDQATTSESDFASLSSGDLNYAGISSFLSGHTGKIVKFYDQVGSVHIDTLAVGGGPTYSANVTNSKSIASFAGDTRLQSTNLFAVTNSQPFSSSFVGRVTSFASVENDIIQTRQGAASGFRLLFYHSGGSPNNWGLFTAGGGQSAGSGGNGPGNFDAVQALWNGASSTIFLNGTSNAVSGIDSSGVTNLDTISIGAEIGGTGFWTGDFCEFGFCSGDKTSNFSAVNSNQHNYWGF